MVNVKRLIVLVTKPLKKATFSRVERAILVKAHGSLFTPHTYEVLGSPRYYVTGVENHSGEYIPAAKIGGEQNFKITRRVFISRDKKKEPNPGEDKSFKVIEVYPITQPSVVDRPT